MCPNHENPNVVPAWRDGLCPACWREAEPYLYPNHSHHLED